MFKPTINIHYDTKYNIKAIRGGKLVQEVNTHNVICDAALYRVANRDIPYWEYLRCGSGSGTPASSDTALFTPLWNDANFELTENAVSYGEDSITWESTASIAAKTDYTGTVTEIGIWGSTNCDNSVADRMLTHALLYDAEGNPISIEKDDLTLLKVTVSITITFSATSPWKTVDPAVNYQRLLNYVSTRLSAYDHDKNYVDDCIAFTLLTACPAHEQWAYIAVGSWPSSHVSLAGVFSPFGLGFKLTDLGDGQIHEPAHGNPRVLATYNVNRLETDATTYPVYFKYAAFTNACYADLTDKNVFSDYVIKNVDVGTGDGVTVEFQNPLNYFIADSEKIYVNGTALVHGVDYTIDNAPNFDMLQELTPCIDAKFSGSDTVRSSYLPLFRRVLKNYNTQPYFTSDGYCAGEYISADKPLIIDMGENVKLNTIRVPASGSTSVTITLAHSSDGETWTDITSFTNGANAVKFDAVTDRYWRVSSSGNFYISSPATWDDPAANAFLGYVGDPLIHFKKAPAADSVITMDVTMDRPFKNTNFVIDMQAELALSI